MNDKIYVVKHETVCDGGEPGFEVAVHKSLQGAMDHYHSIVNDIIKRWYDIYDEDMFTTDSERGSFCMYINDFYQIDHESVIVNEQELLY